MTYPGRFYFDDLEHNWPGDTFHDDGTVRTPIWLKGEHITSDQYDVKVDTSHREIYGSRRYAVSKPDSLFHVRMGAWPKAIVDAMLDICARHFPPNEWSIYVHGHSTGGPFVHTAMQRVENIRGLIGIENSPFGQFFNEIYIGLCFFKKTTTIRYNVPTPDLAESARWDPLDAPHRVWQCSGTLGPYGA